MMIGIGTDLVNIKHFQASLKKTPTLCARVFTEEERAKAKQLGPTKKIAYYAKRFAAKEAFSKACGTGIGAEISWQDISVLNDKKGAPISTLSPKALHFLEKKFKSKKIKVLLSLTDEKDYAMAFVVLENK